MTSLSPSLTVRRRNQSVQQRLLSSSTAFPRTTSFRLARPTFLSLSGTTYQRECFPSLSSPSPPSLPRARTRRSGLKRQSTSSKAPLPAPLPVLGLVAHAIGRQPISHLIVRRRCSSSSTSLHVSASTTFVSCRTEGMFDVGRTLRMFLPLRRKADVSSSRGAREGIDGASPSFSPPAPVPTSPVLSLATAEDRRRSRSSLTHSLPSRRVKALSLQNEGHDEENGSEAPVSLTILCKAITRV